MQDIMAIKSKQMETLTQLDRLGEAGTWWVPPDPS